MLKPGTPVFTGLLAFLTGLGPLSVDMYLASFPEIGRMLSAPPSQVQLTISFYLVGFAIGQIVYGPLADRHGRRPVLLAALAVYVAATLLCALATSIELLIAARFLQALGASGAVVLPRAVVRDVFEGSRVGREIARMAAVMALAPLVAPLIGGSLQTAFGWRSSFVLLLALGAFAAVAVWLWLPETLRQRSPEPVSPLSTLRAFHTFLRNAGFVSHLGFSVCCFGGLFAWISAAAFVLQDLHGLTPFQFGVAFTAGTSGYLLGTLIAARFVTRWGMDRTIGLGCAAMAAGGLAMALVVALGIDAATTLVPCVAIYLGGMGMVLPQAQAGALLPFPQRAGTASSLLGFTQQTFAAAIGAAIGHALGTTAWPLAIAVAIAGCTALALWATTRAIRARHAPRS